MLEAEVSRQEAQTKYDAAHTRQERNREGQFATPIELAQQIASYSLSLCAYTPKTALEPAAGFGSFVSALHTELPNVKITAVEKDQEIADRATDIWRGIADYEHADFLDWANRCESRFDLLVSNPPYVRHHHLSPEQKLKYSGVVQQAASIKLSGLTGLHAYFILVGTTLLKPNGIASWLVPGELFSVSYGRPLLEWMCRNVTVERLHFFEESNLQFSDALVSSCVITLRNAPARPTDMALITRGDYAHPSQSFRAPIATLRNEQKWQHLQPDALQNHDGTTRLGDVMSAHRGIATGSNKWFIRPIDEWDELGVPRRFLLPILPPPRRMKANEVESSSDGWPVNAENLAMLAVGTAIPDDEESRGVRQLLASCPENVRNSYIASHRQPWWSIPAQKPAPIVCTYMSRSSAAPFRFVRNKSHAQIGNSWIGLYPRIPMSESKIDQICATLNAISGDELSTAGREYGGGLRKLEPKEMESLHINI